ncbi:MAG: FkbM family methyltransferase [Aquabacterium sp.]|uniref:FkbM family methyltransferase n=1 Tax=Aquabacterium sp. TaxID=1872578 RepID=UPI0025C0AB8F|nr:FkbM family methyltransferase [Aquabacterium sp.]MBI3380419.1 FkbM family methyltransferase [Aquabacterium sp.]
MGLLRLTVKNAIEHLAPGWMAQRYLRRIEAASLAEKEIALLPLLCQADGIAIDVGANQGLYVHHLLPLVSQVIAFEPLPAMQAQLRRFYADKIRLEPVALSRAPGRAQLRMPAGNPSWATMAQTNKLEMAQPDKAIETVDAEVRTLDSYDYRHVSLIKIDVEGNEEAVLEGAVATLRREQPNLIIEVEERHNAGSVQRVAQFLAALGYEGFYLLDGELKPLSTFDLARDQDIHNVGLQGKVGRYINNFIYVPHERVATLLENLRPAQALH